MREMKESGIEWIGEIPSSWKVSKVKYSYDVVLGKMLQPNQKKDTEELVPYMCAANITWSGVDLSTEKQMWFSESEKSLYLLKNGDLLVTEGGDVAVSCIWNNELPLCCIQNAVHRVRPKNDASNRYLYYWLYMLKSQGYIDLVCNKATLAHFTKEKLDRCFLVLPPSYEQKRIASYLDARCDEIDALIAAKEKTNALLRERRQSIIYEAVTKGLDPNAPMKDSGVEWIGEIPEGWSTIRIRYLGSFQNGISKAGEYFGSGNPFVSYSDVYKNEVLPTMPTGLIESTESERKLYSVEKGDIFFTRTSETKDEIGMVAVCQETIPDATFAGFLIRMRPTNNCVSTDFLRYYFSCGLQREYFSKEMTLVTRASLGQDLLKNMVVTIPPIVEQQEIADFLDSQTHQINSIINHNNTLVHKLREYRQSLIYEAVTGKSEV